jgi:hypothetical protein
MGHQSDHTLPSVLTVATDGLGLFNAARGAAWGTLTHPLVMPRR